MIHVFHSKTLSGALLKLINGGFMTVPSKLPSIYRLWMDYPFLMICRPDYSVCFLYEFCILFVSGITNSLCLYFQGSGVGDLL